MSTLLQDLRYALRQLRHSPGFTLTAVLTLALGIGANVVVFSVLNSLILQPLNFSHPRQVVSIQCTNNGYGVTSYPNYRDLRDRNSMFSGVAMYRFIPAGLETSSGAQQVWGDLVSGNYFGMLGVNPYLGRLIQPADDIHPGASPYIVLSYNSWRDRFGGDKGIVGRTIRLNKSPYTVLGVAPKGFQGTERWFQPEFFVPAMNQAQMDGYSWLEERGDQNIWIIGRLKPGITAAAAAANVNAIAHQLAKDYPQNNGDLAFKLAQPGFMGDVLGGPIHAFLLGIMLLAGLVLLAACANLGSLFSARTSDRSRELAIRVAVGAGRGRILRQLLTESIVVSLLGGTFGLLIALGLLKAIDRWNPATNFPGRIAVHPDATVYTFAFFVSMLAGTLFGLVPLRQIWKTDPNQAIKSGANVLPSKHGWALRDILLAVQIAICCLLVTASLVALRGLGRTLKANLGFNPNGVTLANFDLHLDGYNDNDATQVQKHLLDNVSHLPSVTSAAYANTTPLDPNQSFTPIFSSETSDFGVRNEKFDAGRFKISPGYLHTAQTHLLAGREFSWHDDAKAPRVAIVNQTFARKLFGIPNVVGRYFRLGPKDRLEIVGVVEDGKYTTISEDPRPAFFYPILQDTDSSTVLLVRSRQNGPAIVAELRDAICKVDPNLPISSLGSWHDDLTTVLLPTYAATAALGVFGALAILLAITGIFGLASYTVSRRMRELGIRVALGASHRQVVGAALRRPILLLAGGSLVGLALGIAASRLLASIVYQATSNDPVVLIGVVLTMLLVGAIATWIPAVRVFHVDPSEVLREH